MLLGACPLSLLPRGTTVPRLLQGTSCSPSEDQPIASAALVSQFILHDPSELSIFNIQCLYLPLNSRSQPLRSPSRLFRKLTTRFKPPTLHPKSANLKTASPPRSPTQPSTHRSAVPSASADAVAVKRRQAALQQCGLVSLPRRDLSQLEAELDRRFTRIIALPQDEQDHDDLTSAEKIRREWQAKNEDQPDSQADDVDPTDPNDIPSNPLNEGPKKLDSLVNPEERMTTGLTLSLSPDPLLGSKSPVFLSPIQETFSIPVVPEEDVAALENEKVRLPITFNCCSMLTSTLYRTFPLLSFPKQSTLSPSLFPIRLSLHMFTCRTYPCLPLPERASGYRRSLST